MVGTLYIVTNDINEKVYIGKTYTSLDERWKRHISDAYRIDRDNNNKFYNAIVKYGPEHFRIKEIERFEQGILEQKEIEYISKYNSYHNGYNSTLGGDGHPLINYNRDAIYNMYINGMSTHDIKDKLGIGTTRPIAEILRQYGIDTSKKSSQAVEIAQYDENGMLLNIFRSKNEAYRWLLENNNSMLKRAHAYNYIKQSCEAGCKRFGYYWKYTK